MNDIKQMCPMCHMHLCYIKIYSSKYTAFSHRVRALFCNKNGIFVTVYFKLTYYALSQTTSHTRSFTRTLQMHASSEEVANSNRL